MAESIERADTLGQRPVARVKLAQYSWDSGETAAVTKEFPFTGVVKCFVSEVSDNTGNRTITVAVVDEDSYSIYSKGTIAENATTTTVLTRDTDIFVPAGCSVTVTPSGDPGVGGMTADVTFYGAAQ
ncbi:MAG: hypothetical protein GY832_11595 [Chloroflexi bacterium]|nr:hypothetical protein [Chloroflexota bacterium]